MVKLEYIWLDGYQPEANLRSKTKVITDDFNGKLEECPQWSFDGSSTKQDSDLFEKERVAWGKVSDNKIAYHDRPIDDKYWNKMIDKGKEPLIIIDFDEDRNQLRVVDGNHRLTVYLNKGFSKIPTVITNDTINYIKSLI